MSKTSMSIRLDSEVKEQAQLVFNHLGMDMTLPNTLEMLGIGQLMVTISDRKFFFLNQKIQDFF